MLYALLIALLIVAPIGIQRESLDYLGDEYTCAPLWPSPDGWLRVEEWTFSDGMKLIFAVRESDDKTFAVWLHGRIRIYDPCEYLDEIASGLPGYPVPDGWTSDDCQ